MSLANGQHDVAALLGKLRPVCQVFIFIFLHFISHFLPWTQSYFGLLLINKPTLHCKNCTTQDCHLTSIDVPDDFKETLQPCCAVPYRPVVVSVLPGPSSAGLAAKYWDLSAEQ